MDVEVIALLNFPPFNHLSLRIIASFKFVNALTDKKHRCICRLNCSGSWVSTRWSISSFKFLTYATQSAAMAISSSGSLAPTNLRVTSRSWCFVNAMESVRKPRRDTRCQTQLGVRRSIFVERKDLTVSFKFNLKI